MAFWARPFLALPAGTRVAFAGGAHPAAVLLDLAIQAAGLVAVPLELAAGEGPEAQLARLGCRAWAEPEDADPAPDHPAGVERIRLPAGPPSPSEDLSFSFRPDGGVVCLRSGLPLEIPSSDLAGWAGLLQERIGASVERGREILVLGGSLAGWAERGMLAWATLTGAVVLLEPDPTERIDTAAWARATLLQGTASELSRLRTKVEADRGPFWSRWLRGQRPRRPLGRLRTLVLAGSGPLLPEDATFWETRGVKVVPMPDLAAEVRGI